MDDNTKIDLNEVGWDLPQEKEKWRHLVNTVTNFGLHKMWGIF
jgi:hypothetical protein